VPRCVKGVTPFSRRLDKSPARPGFCLSAVCFPKSQPTRVQPPPYRNGGAGSCFVFKPPEEFPVECPGWPGHDQRVCQAIPVFQAKKSPRGRGPRCEKGTRAFLEETLFKLPRQKVADQLSDVAMQYMVSLLMCQQKCCAARKGCDRGHESVDEPASSSSLLPVLPRERFLTNSRRTARQTCVFSAARSLRV